MIVSPASIRPHWLRPPGVAILAALVLLCAATDLRAQTRDLHAQLDRPRIGLVLSGGGARGAAHIGVLRVLEELRVPVDVIAGTSMGAIVGGAYASGMSVAEMEQALPRLNARVLFDDELARAERPMRSKSEDFVPYIGAEFGVDSRGPSLPRGAVAGVSLEAVLRGLVKRHGEHDFDTLPIPFRAVATDIVSGKMAVFRRGELATAMRASMAVPGLVAPLDRDGKLYVDGGLTRNLPVDVAREMGADIIIAVNLGTPLLRRDQLGSFIGVSAQTLVILTEQNVERSLHELRSDDVLVSPELGNFLATDFDRMREAVPIGEAAAHKVAARLARFALAPDEYARWRGGQSAPPARQPPVIDALRFEGMHFVAPEVLLAEMRTRAGAPLDQATLDQDLRRLYARGDFTHVTYRIDTIEGRRVLTIAVEEQPAGPVYMRFGLGLHSNLRGDSTFDLYARLRRPWINALGGELRAEVRLGEQNRGAAEFFQPIDEKQRYFIAPRVEALRRPLRVYDEDAEIARYEDLAYTAGLDVGYDFGHVAELRTGLVRGTRRFSLQIGTRRAIDEADTGIGIGAWRTAFVADTYDHVDFPRSGHAARLEAHVSRVGLGAERDYARWLASLGIAHSIGEHTLQLALKGGAAFGHGDLPLYEQFHLGGPLELSGYRLGQLTGQSMAFARAVYQRRFFEQGLLRGAFAGFAFEAGRVGATAPGLGSGLRTSVTPFIAMDSPLGPLYLGVGLAPGGHRTAYLFLGHF